MVSFTIVYNEMTKNQEKKPKDCYKNSIQLHYFHFQAPYICYNVHRRRIPFGYYCQKRMLLIVQIYMYA